MGVRKVPHRKFSVDFKPQVWSGQRIYLLLGKKVCIERKRVTFILRTIEKDNSYAQRKISQTTA